MAEPLPTTTLAWLRQTAKFEGAVTAQVLLHLLERVEALEAADHFVGVPKMAPTPTIRAALERLVEIDDANSTNGADPDTTVWDDAIAAARAALARWTHPATPPAPEAGEVQP